MPQIILKVERSKGLIDSFYNILDDEVRKEYQEFNNYCLSIEMLLVLNLVLTGIISPYLLWSTSFRLQYILVFAAVLCGWVLYLIDYFHQEPGLILVTPVRKGLDKFLFVLSDYLKSEREKVQMIFLLSIAFMTSFHSFQQTQFWLRLDFSENIGTFLPIGPTFLAMFGPLLVISITREYHPGIMMASVGIPAMTVIYSAYLLGEQSSIPIILGDLIFVTLLNIDRSKQPVVLFLMSRRLRQTLHEKELMEAENHILITDDSLSLSKMMSRLLSKQGYEVSVAENGLISFNAWKEKRQTGFDVILMDLQMPVMDGLEATRRIRDYERNHSVGDDNTTSLVTGEKKSHQLIIGMSANSDHETMEEAKKAGVDAFIAKPFTVEEFVKVITSLL